MPSIGRYEIEREIGRGAMGVVYLARDPRLHRQVAVKTYSLPDGISEEQARQFHERFLREARAAASLSHPGIVTIYDAGDDPGLGMPYIAMEFVQGESLKQRLEKSGRLDPAWVLAFGAVLADALHVAHRAGIVHRDIKPANILVREADGAVKIADFGVARLKASDLTQTGSTMGSPLYMSPEQIKAGDLDGRSDLFSLAVVLYESLCGKRPFRGDDLVSLTYSIAHDTQVPLGSQLPGCPPGLDAFFNRALSKDPGARFADGAAFREAFLQAGAQRPPRRVDETVADAVTLAAPPPAKPAPGGSGRFLGLKLAAAAALCAGLAVAAFLWLGRPTPLKATDRDARATPPTSAEPVRQAPAPGDAAHEEKGRQEQKALPQQRTSLTDVVPVAAATPRKPPSIKVIVPAGTEIRLTLDAAVGSSSSHAGDTFTARITAPVIVGDRVAIPSGSRVHGGVSGVTPAGKGLGDKAGSLSLSFDRVVTPFGFGAPMSASMTRVGPKSGKKTAKAIGGGAAGGALLGKILGGSGKNAAVGSVVGGAIGTGIAAGMKGEEVELPAGAPLTVTLDQPLTISVNP